MKKPKVKDKEVKAEELPKEILIKKESKVEKLLSEATAEKPEPRLSKKGKRIGRPPKTKKITKFDVEKYEGNLIAKTLNDFLTKMSNNMLRIIKKSSLTEDEEMKTKDCMIGEALCYTMDYYGKGLDHPIVILIVAFGIFGWNLFSKMGEIKETAKEKAKKEHGTV